jgi:UDP-N-acetylmuramoyl-tripeptide--D-alanyl-D-alanine ligase
VDLKLSEVYRFFNREVKTKDAAVRSVSTDSRTVKKGDLFFAIKGEVTDGHKFIQAALDKGACCVVCEKAPTGSDLARIIKVKSSIDAYLKLAGYYYSKFKVKTAAVTGSNGKTTTKEALAAMLAQKYEVLKSEKSFNNHVGLPATLFNLTKKHEALVVELGMNNPGEIRNLCTVLKIDAGIITNIGRAHIGRLGSQENIAKAKAEIISGMKKNGTICLNANDAFFRFLEKKAQGLKVRTFGINAVADINAVPLSEDKGRMEFLLFESGKMHDMQTPLKGLHNLSNLAAAACAAVNMGVEVKDILSAVAGFDMLGLMRYEEITDKKRGIKIINDAYNANPDSFSAAIETLKSKDQGPLIVVAGSMFELGKNSNKLHAEIGSKLALLPVKKLFLVGKEARAIAKGFLEIKGSAYREDVLCYKDANAAIAPVKKAIKKGDTLFFKGSRRNKLETIIKSM